MGASLAIAAVLLTPWAALDLPHRAPSAGAIGAVVVLGLLCTATAFVVYSILIGEAGTSRATVITYVNPVVAVALGVLLLGERPGAGAVAGLLLILAGGWLSTDGRLPPGVSRGLARNPAQSASRRDRRGAGFRTLGIRGTARPRPDTDRGLADTVRMGNLAAGEFGSQR